MNAGALSRYSLPAILVITLCAMPALGQRTNYRANLGEGGRLYQQNCVTCHGMGGKGDGDAAAQLDPKPADLTSPKTQAKTDDELLEVIKLGRPGTAMPSWNGDLNDQEMLDVLGYIRTLAAS